jgi:flavin reductase ActVB
VTTRVPKTHTALDSATFKEAMSLLAAPLTIVTTRDKHGCPWGFTASSVASVSLEPPLVLVGISHTSSCFASLSDADEFVINLLESQHQDLARRFATSGVDRFAGVPFADWPGSDAPLLTGIATAFLCVTVDRLPVGDHDLVIGKLIGLRRAGQVRSGPTSALVPARLPHVDMNLEHVPNGYDNGFPRGHRSM